MRILKIIHGYPPNYNAGSEVYSQSVCDELCKEHEVFVFTREENPYEPDFTFRWQIIHERLTIIYVNMAQSKDGFRHKRLDQRFYQILSEIKPDVAHIGHLNHLSTGIVDMVKKRNIPIAFTLHDFWLMCPRGQFLQRNFGYNENLILCRAQEDRKCALYCYNAYFTGIGCSKEKEVENWTEWVRLRMEETKRITKLVDHFIAPSLYLKSKFVNEFGIPEHKITYLDYGFPTHYLTPTHSRLKKKEFAFGYIGTHIPSKGINLLIEAFKKVEGNARLLIWGSKDQQSTLALQKMAENSDLPIEFKGAYVNRNLADEVFSRVNAIVVPSIWAENSPLVIHEAQACKIPVITADFGGMAEYVHHQVNGLLFEHRSSEDLYKQMQWAVEHSDEMISYGERGYINDPAGNVPQITDHCTKLISIYQSIKNNKHAKQIIQDNH